METSSDLNSELDAAQSFLEALPLSCATCAKNFDTPEDLEMHDCFNHNDGNIQPIDLSLRKDPINNKDTEWQPLDLSIKEGDNN